MTLAEAKMFLLNYDNYIRVFGERLLKKCLKEFTCRDFATSEYAEQGSYLDQHHIKKGYPILCACTWHIFEEWRGEWMRKVNKKAVEYQIPQPTQLNESLLLRACLLAKFPYLTSFDFPTYHLDDERGLHEIYIACGNKQGMAFSQQNLYCPIDAFFKNDFSLIEKRMKAYFIGYHCSAMNDTVGQEKDVYATYVIPVLNTPTAKKLKAILDKNAAESLQKTKKI